MKAGILIAHNESAGAESLRDQLRGLGQVTNAIADSQTAAPRSSAQDWPDLVLMNVDLGPALKGNATTELLLKPRMSETIRACLARDTGGQPVNPEPAGQPSSP